MQNQLILFVGIVRRGDFESLVQRGIPVGVIFDTNWSMGSADPSKFSIIEYHDFKRAEMDLLQVVDRIKKEWNIMCVLVTHEFYVLPGASVTEHLGLPGISKDVALACIDKTLMHERFVQEIGPQSTAKYLKIHSREDLVKFTKDTDFPIILKPANLAGSVFITLNHSLEELRQNYDHMVEEISAFFRKSGRNDVYPCIQAEEFLEGTTHSTDCIVDAAGNVSTTPIVDEITGREVGWDDFHLFAHFTPSRLQVSDQEKLHRLAIAGVKALGIRSSTAHVELIQTAQGPRLLEIGARPGGNRPKVYDLSYGIDLMYSYYQIRSGNAPDGVQPQRMTTTAIVSLYPRKQGILTKINHLDRIEQLKTYCFHDVKTRPGRLIGPAKQGYFVPLSVGLRNDNAEDVKQDIRELQSWQDVFVVSEA